MQPCSGLVSMGSTQPNPVALALPRTRLERPAARRAVRRGATRSQAGRACLGALVLPNPEDPTCANASGESRGTVRARPFGCPLAARDPRNPGPPAQVLGPARPRVERGVRVISGNPPGSAPISEPRIKCPPHYGQVWRGAAMFRALVAHRQGFVSTLRRVRLVSAPPRAAQDRGGALRGLDSGRGTRPVGWGELRGASTQLSSLALPPLTKRVIQDDVDVADDWQRCAGLDPAPAVSEEVSTVTGPDGRPQPLPSIAHP